LRAVKNCLDHKQIVTYLQQTLRLFILIKAYFYQF